MNSRKIVKLLSVSLLVIALTNTGCDKTTTQPDHPPVITQFQPEQFQLMKGVNDTIAFSIMASDEDGDAVNYKFLKDNIEVSTSNEYEWIVDKKGSTVVMGVAYNDLADTIKWAIDVGNRAPIAEVENVTATIESPVDLDGSNSYHPDSPLNEIVSYYWEQLSGLNIEINNSDNSVANFTPLTRGEYEFVLTVTDNLNQQDKDTLTTTIESYFLTINTIDVLNDEPINNLEVLLLNSGKTAFTQNGDISFEVPTEGRETLLIRDEATSDYGDYFDYSQPLEFNDDIDLSVQLIPNVPDSIYSSYYPNILNFIKYMTRTDGSLSDNLMIKWRGYPIQTFYNRNEHPNQDYTNALINALGDVNNPNLEGWENKTGIDLFEEVQQDPTEGIIFDYGSSSGSHIVRNWYPDHSPRHATIYIENDLPTPLTIYRDNIHEIGHAIFNSSKHSPDPIHAMTGGGGDGGPSNYEAEAIKRITLLENFTEMSYYLED